MRAEAYGTLAEVYDWLLPEELLTPEGSADAFAPFLDGLAPGARVLDCACGTGLLAVGLALRGFAVTACDASEAMVARTRDLAAGRGVAIDARVCRWDQLPGESFDHAPFDAVICVGNSLPHAPGTDGRRVALRGMAAVLRRGGPLVLTSRNWELVHAQGSGLRVSDGLLERDGAKGLVVYGWSLPADWEAEHHLDIAVALIADDGAVTTHAERLSFWPFRRETLDDDLRAAGLEPTHTTYEKDVDRYLVSGRRR
jgi:SAM-dependent methyltransferase